MSEGTHPALFVRHADDVPNEPGACGLRRLLVSRDDANSDVAAWAHVVDVDAAKPHFHRVATELYFVLEGEGAITLDGETHTLRKESLVHIPPGVVHSVQGKMRVLVVGIPDICDDDLFYPDETEAA